MAVIKPLFGTANQPITITLTSLGIGAARQSTVIDNTTALFLDVLVQIKSAASAATTGDKCLYVYAYGTADGTAYGDTVTGTDGTITLNSPTQLRLVGVLNVPATTTVYTSSPMSIATAFGGILPQKWGIVVVNSTGVALTATAGNHGAWYQGIQAQSV